MREVGDERLEKDPVETGEEVGVLAAFVVGAGAFSVVPGAR